MLELSQVNTVLLVLVLVISSVLFVRTRLVRRVDASLDTVEAKAARESLLTALQIVQAQYVTLIREHQRVRTEAEVWRDRAMQLGHSERD